MAEAHADATCPAEQRDTLLGGVRIAAGLAPFAVAEWVPLFPFVRVTYSEESFTDYDSAP